MNSRSHPHAITASFVIAIIFLSLTNLFTFTEVAAQALDCTGIRVHGRVVDKDKNPAKAIDVYLEPKKYVAFGFDRFISSKPTNEKGEFNFCVDSDFAKSQGQWLLFTSKLDSRGLIDLVQPPYDLLRGVDSSFDGPSVDLSKGDVELGDVPIARYHHPVTLSMGRLTNHRAFDEQLLKNLVIRIKSEKGHTAEETSLSMQDISHLTRGRTSSIEVTLPAGRWQVEILNGTGIVGQSTIFQVETDENCIQINPVRGSKLP